MGSVLAAARRGVDVVVPSPVGEWAPGVGGGVSLLQRALVQQETEHGHGSAVLGELVRRLRAEGLEVLEGVGHGPHAIPIAVASESDEGLLAVAVDGDAPGATGAGRSPLGGRAVGRDDVRLRHEQLTRMGWAPVRVRSSDVFSDPAREVARVLSALRERTSRTP